MPRYATVSIGQTRCRARNAAMQATVTASMTAPVISGAPA